MKKLRGDETSEERIGLAISTKDIDLLYIFAKHDLDSSVAHSVLENPICNDELKSIVLERFPLGAKKQYGENLCPLLWNHVSTFSNGDVRYCCEMIFPPFGTPKDDDGNALNVHTHDIHTIRNNDLGKSIRKEMIEGGKPDICRQCYHREELGMHSKRTSSWSHYGSEVQSYIDQTEEDGSVPSTIPIRNLDLRFGNKCNLKCRSCGPGDSDLWYEDYFKVSNGKDKVQLPYYGSKKYDIVYKDGKYKANTNDFTWHEDSPFWNDMIERIEHVDRIYFTGGEPTIIKQHRQLLEYVIEKDLAKNINLDYNTNMHATPTYLGEYWQHFKGVYIGASIDGYGVVQGYMRPPSTWKSVSDNIIKLEKLPYTNIDIKFSPTISVMNILNITKLADWLLSNRFSKVHPIMGNHTLYGPKYFSVQVLPRSVKEIVNDHYNDWFKSKGPDARRSYELMLDPVLKFMNEEDTYDSEWEKFMFNIDKMDKIRNENWETGLPELYQALKSVNLV